MEASEDEEKMEMLTLREEDTPQVDGQHVIEKEKLLYEKKVTCSRKCFLLNVSFVVAVTVIAATLGVVVWGVRVRGSNSIDQPEFRLNEALSDSIRNGPQQRMRVVKEILKMVPLIDGHNDWPFKLRQSVDTRLSQLDLRSHLAGFRTDIPRLQQGGVGAQFWSIYADCSSQYMDAVQYAMEQIDIVLEIVRQYPDVFTFATSTDDIYKAHVAGKIASLLGMEGGHMIGESLAVLRQFYRLGVRYLTLTHNCNTPWSGYHSFQSDTKTPSKGGLTEWGKLVVLEMNRLGMLVDLTHVSEHVIVDALNTSRAPVIFSHSLAHVLCPHPRNVKEYVLTKLKENGGILMVNFMPEFVKCSLALSVSNNISLYDVADQLDYLKDVLGPDHIGLGSDFDGYIESGPAGLVDVSHYPDLLSELLRRRWTVTDVMKVTGSNLLRVFSDVEFVRDSLSTEAARETPIDYSIIPDQQCRTPRTAEPEA